MELGHLKSEAIDIRNELDQYKTAHDKLTAGLKEAVAESIKYKRERDTLIKDVEKLRKTIDNYKLAIKELKFGEDALRLQSDEYFGLWQDVDSKYKRLTEHIKDKALNNPSEHRYFRLVHFIDDLEAE
ncbi:hypothetical protein [Mammaliicoccus sciuri]|uniref:hypothetical protein n=1 Tax=Mammaliicoccus sciuri TaxID=1296 RepID=UPI00265C88EF|nr:hypothetical protein [Mammaliicoccus sciuri]MDO0948198.1 hypothetical protein [Mammaliicoccus sciuri]MDO0953431.1 hypothetical protein [Mammaliicoccus sciuri]